MTNKFIFLDIDGVLNNLTWLRSEEHLLIPKTLDNNSRNPHYWFEPRAVELLNEIIRKTNAHIVVSSSWRIGKSVEQLQNIFREVGIISLPIDKTPRLGFISTDDGYSASVPRGNEIKAWMEMNKDILGDKMTKVKYVILDDDGDMLYWQRNNFIHVDPYVGITDLTVRKAIHILN